MTGIECEAARVGNVSRSEDERYYGFAAVGPGHAIAYNKHRSKEQNHPLQK